MRDRATLARRATASMLGLVLGVVSERAWAVEGEAPARSRIFAGFGPGLISSSLSTGRLDEVDQGGALAAAVDRLRTHAR
jgi:hypothetical protein